jgi:CheY-like chemotaxis protein
MCYDVGRVPVPEPRTIVIVEDDDGIRETMGALLAEEGFSVVQAANGAEGLAALRAAADPCLVLLDLWMPVMNGWQMLAEMRADARLARVPVLVISAAGDLTPPEGAAAFLRKPIRLETLLENVDHFRLRAS